MKLKKQPFALVIALLAVFVFASCGDDDAGNPDIPAELLGTWDVISSEASNCTDPGDNGTEGFICNSMNCVFIEFRADGTLTSTDLFDGVTDSEEGTYVVAGSQLTVTIDTEVTVTTYNVSGNTLVLFVEDSDGCDNRTTLTKR